MIYNWYIHDMLVFKNNNISNIFFSARVGTLPWANVTNTFDNLYYLMKILYSQRPCKTTGGFRTTAHWFSRFRFLNVFFSSFIFKRARYELIHKHLRSHLLVKIIVDNNSNLLWALGWSHLRRVWFFVIQSVFYVSQWKWKLNVSARSVIESNNVEEWHWKMVLIKLKNKPARNMLMLI